MCGTWAGSEGESGMDLAFETRKTQKLILNEIDLTDMAAPFPGKFP